ncbi:MAG TPA: glycosyltransferase family 4 protein [Armatimonadota bacterium]|nr:glycosyltransferase family 4 protein [Armatimonadota bacterium]
MSDRPLLRPVVPENTEFVLLSFEGPDQYSLAGGLGVRVAELSRALADAGFRTHLFFVGDPGKPATEAQQDGRLILHRWCQWISRYYPNGVYQGEKEKIFDFRDSVPEFVAQKIIAPAVEAGRTPVIMGEEWHTAAAMSGLSDLLYSRRLRQNAVLLWNANHTMGFENIDFGRLNYTTRITTVSHYMKHTMWSWGINPVVLPNGIPDRLLTPQDPAAVRAIREAVGGDLMLVKVGRWDPDKRWNMAVDAAARLKRMGLRTRLVCRGGIEPYEGEVLHNAHALGLEVRNVSAPATKNLAGWVEALRGAATADVINLKFFVPEELLWLLYAGADAVLANSGKEPFGIVGLEVMACGGVAVTGATGEEYAQAFKNALVLETDDPNEIVAGLAYLREHPGELERMRAVARRTAAEYTWAQVVSLLCKRVQFLNTSQNL